MSKATTPEETGNLQQAAREGLAIGLREHIPGALGILLRGCPLMGFAAFAHFVLGPSVLVTALLSAASAGAAAVAIARRPVASPAQLPVQRNTRDGRGLGV